MNSLTRSVSVIVPCYNEEATISMLLDSLVNQTYPLENIEVIIADGMSTDQTRYVIEKFHNTHPELNLQIIMNEKRHIPSGLNLGIKAAHGEYIIRLDAHSIPNEDYIEQCIGALERGYGDNVGGIWKIRPANQGWIARSIAAAAAHPIGVGDALYRIGARAQHVDTVPFGAFRRDLAIKIGLFDESLLTNEDYEFNTRIRNIGGTIWLDPDIRSTYFARSNIIALAQQYWRYGYWKAQMLKRYPQTIRWRQAIPPIFAGSLLGLLSLGFFLPLAWNLFWIEVIIYICALLIAGLHLSIKRQWFGYLVGLPIAIATMHITWGLALLWGIIYPPSKNPATRNNELCQQ